LVTDWRYALLVLRDSRTNFFYLLQKSLFNYEPMAYIPYPEGIGVLRHFYKQQSSKKMRQVEILMISGCSKKGEIIGD